MIYTITDAKKICNETLKAAFPSVTVYDNDTLDGYKRPSFFTEIRSHGRSKESPYLTQTGFTFIITYFEQTHDEAHCLEVYEKICAAFEPAVKVKGQKRLVVRETDFNWIDTNADKLQVTIMFYDSIELGGYTDDSDLMEEINLNENYKGGLS